MAKNSGPQNFAEDKAFAEQFAVELLADWRRLYAERTERENRWQDAYDAWNVGGQDPMGQRNYQGRAQIYLPQLRKEVETMTRRLVKGLFPEDYLKAEPGPFESTDLALDTTLIVKHYLDNVMQFKAKATPWLKQGVMLGTSPLRSFWKREENEVIYKKRYFKEDERGNLVPDFRKIKENIISYEGPKAAVADVFQTWVYPSTAQHPEDIQRVYFRDKVDLKYLQEMEKKGISIPVAFLEDEGKEGDAQFPQTEMRMQAIGDSAFLSGKREGKLYDYMEVWGKAEIDGKFIPYVCVIINEKHCIRLQQNPLWHQSPPFDWMRFILAPNEFWGRGLPEASLPVQHQLNDVLNQGMDSTTLALQSITIINPAFAPNAASFEVEPNAIWWADPQAVKQFTFPDLSDIAIKNAGQLRSIITEMSDNQPQLPDPIAGKARSTGQAQLAIDEWQTDLYSFINLIAIEALAPLASKVHALLQQNIADSDIIKINVRYAGNWVNKIVTPNDIIGRFKFHWLGSIQVENQSVKTQQMLNFLKIIPQIPPEAQIQIKWDNLLIRLLRDGFNIKDVQNIIETEHLKASVPPALENRALDMGGEVEVTSSDDDALHLAEHKYGQAKATDKYVRALYDKHISDHTEQQAKKAQLAQIQQAQMQQQMAMMQAGAGPIQQKGHPQGPVPGMAMGNAKPNAPNPAGNQTQISPGVSPADLARGNRG